MTRLLASVRDVNEARIALKTPIGLLDLKDPQGGALGAVDISVVDACVKLADGICPVSATAGDLPLEPTPVLERTEALMECGVDYVKIGMFSSQYLRTYPAALKDHASKVALVAVLFVDRLQSFSGPLQLLAQAGFAGVMLDTADKNAGSLRSWVNPTQLESFVRNAHELSLLCGLAGSLRQEDIPELVALNPDYLGFRTALCENEQRDGSLSLQALQTLHTLL